MPQPDLAVGSVFSGYGHNARWLELQLQALERTTTGFDHFVYLNQAEERIFPHSTIVGRAEEKRDATPSHLEGLHALRDFFRARNYQRYLILDSDCFPIRENWMQILDEAMALAGKRFAAPARVENLHLFPHPCALYTADASCIDFAVEEGTNFLRETFSDISCAGPRVDWLPLIKTNRISPHQFLAAIYYDVFYHHGCGTRPFGMRPSTIHYYNHFWARCADPTALFDQIMEQGDAFVQTLR